MNYLSSLFLYTTRLSVRENEVLLAQHLGESLEKIQRVGESLRDDYAQWHVCLASKYYSSSKEHRQILTQRMRANEEEIFRVLEVDFPFESKLVLFEFFKAILRRKAWDGEVRLWVPIG